MSSSAEIMLQAPADGDIACYVPQPVNGILGMPLELIEGLAQYIPQSGRARLAQTCKALSNIMTGVMFKTDSEEDHHALWWACVSNEVGTLQRSLCYGAGVKNHRFADRHDIPLHPTFGDFSQGLTPIIIAIRFGSLDVFRHLLSSGASVNLPGITAINSFGHCWYPMNWAVNVLRSGSGFHSCLELLIKHGADINQQPFRLPPSGDNRSEPTGYETGGMRPVFEQLHFRPRHTVSNILELRSDIYLLLGGRKAKLITLLKLGADPNAREIYTEQTPIFRLATNLDSYQHRDYYNTSGTVTLRQEVDDLYTEVIVPYSIDMFDDLIRAGGDPNVACQNSYGEWERPLHVLCNRSGLYHALIDFLMERGANINATDENGRTPLYRMMLNPPHRKDAVWSLVLESVNVNGRDHNGQTALHFLCQQYDRSIARLEDTIKILIREGADLLDKDNNGKTPCDLLRGRKNAVWPDVVKDLEKAEKKAMERAKGAGKNGGSSRASNSKRRGRNKGKTHNW